MSKTVFACLFLSLLFASLLIVSLQCGVSSGTIPGDINGDGKVNLLDLELLAAAFGSHRANYDYPGEPASPNWNPKADLNGDGIVDLGDLVILAAHYGQTGISANQALYIGWRSSEYGVHYQGSYDDAPSQPSPSGQKPSSWFVNTSESMANLIGSGAQASGIWIIGEVDGRTAESPCYLDIPQPSSGSYPNIVFRSDALNPSDAYLTAFDNAGLKIWLQSEPGLADINTITKLLMDTYGNHSCVIGVGIDAEWYPNTVTAADAQSWTSYIQNNYGSQYKFFIKHYDVSKMPPDPKIPGCVWICDNQGFSSESAMLSSRPGSGGMGEWRNHFSGSEVGFQVGYSADSSWTRPLGIQKVSDDLFSLGSNVNYVIWSDEDILHYYP